MHYFKYNQDDLNQLFIPWKEPEYAKLLSDLEKRQTRLKQGNKMYRFAWTNFFNGVESDSLGMEEFIGLDNHEMPFEIEVDYDSFQKDINIEAFKKDLDNYVLKLKVNFLKKIESDLLEIKTDIAATILFKDYLTALNLSYKELKNIHKSKNLHLILKIIANAHISSYIETYKYFSDFYRDRFDIILKKLDIRTSVNTVVDQFNNIERYIEPNNINLFYHFEVKLIELGYLNQKRNNWTAKQNKSLITFFLYCRSRGLFRKPFDNVKDNNFLVVLQKRYNLDLKTMQKYSKWKDYNLNSIRAEYFILDKLK